MKYKRKIRYYYKNRTEASCKIIEHEGRIEYKNIKLDFK